MIKRILHYLKPYKVRFVFSLITTLIYVGLTLYAPYIIGVEIVGLFNQATFEMSVLVEPIIKLAVVTILGCIFGAIMGRLLNVISYLMIKDIRIDAFNKILNLPVSYIDSHVHGDILIRVTRDVDQVWDGLLHGFTHIFRGIVAIIITIVFMFITKWDIALIVVLLTPLSVIAAMLIAKFSHKSFVEQAKITGAMGGLSNEMITNQKTVIAYGLNDENNTKYQQLDQQLYKVGVRAQFTAAFARPTTRLVNAIIYASVALYGTIWIASSNEDVILKVGVLTVFLAYASQYTRPFNEISDVASELASSFASLKRVLELLDEKELNDETNLSEVTTNIGEYEMKNVHFSYVPGIEILKDISFKASENKKIAIVGKTGCGKTTLINLLMHYYDVNSGEILFDKININELKRNSLRKHVGMVLQDTWLFKGTIKDNIKYAKLDATDDEVIETATLAKAHDFIMKLKDGYNTIIDDDDGLSTGEKQLICIARLMINLPKVLILDEATSNIDTRTEVNIQKAFNIMMDGRTSIVIAHRLSTIRHADLIIVMKDGKIIETGNHEELIKKHGYYNELYNSL
ncbi:MAG: ABC transporter ATP-binding protein/permease [Bacilli bacterium]|nr:ABC transporter ATP-binding protein/permease [Bacilli bacterium]